MRGRLLCTVVGIGSVLFVGEHILAHHSLSSEFNPGKVLLLTGTVSDVSWANPHVAIKIAVRDAAGGSELWTVHGDSPATLERNGWSRRTLTVGQPLSVCGYEAKSGHHEMAGEQVGMANGARLLLGTTEVKSCLRVSSVPHRILGPDPRVTSGRGGSPAIGISSSPIGMISNPVGAMGNPIGPMGNPIGPVVSPSPVGH